MIHEKWSNSSKVTQVVVIKIYQVIEIYYLHWNLYMWEAEIKSLLRRDWRLRMLLYLFKVSSDPNAATVEHFVKHKWQHYRETFPKRMSEWESGGKIRMHFRSFFFGTFIIFPISHNKAWEKFIETIICVASWATWQLKMRAERVRVWKNMVFGLIMAVQAATLNAIT